LHFDDGLYIVGHQDTGIPPALYKQGRSPLHFKDCTNLSLVGGPDTRIKFDDCLYFGAFDHTTGDALLYPCGLSCAAVEDMANIGICIHLERCSYVNVEDLALDGNMNNIWIGGSTSSDGTQLQHTGIVLDDSWEVAIEDVDVYQFCLDGMFILAKELSVFTHGDDMRIALHGCSFSRNGRNGLSWMGGAGVTFGHCQFELNGTYLIRSSPGAGVDIEYHGFVFAYDSAPIGNGTFVACVFKYNKGFGLVSDVGVDYVPYVPGPFRFFSCTFIGSEGGVALWPNAPDMRFDYCRIHGRTVVPFDCQLTGDLEDRTRFYLCEFDETYYDSEADVRYSMSWHPYDGFVHLIQADRNTGHGGVTLELCTLRTYCRLMPFSIHGPLPVPGQPNYNAKMLGCTYVYEGAHIEPANPPPGEYSANFGQFANTEVDVLNVRFPDGYNLSLLIGVDIQIHQAWDHASWPTQVQANFPANMVLDPQPPSSFPFYGICPEPYLDPIPAYYMCTDCPDGCANCVLHVPPPENGPECPAEKVSVGRHGDNGSGSLDEFQLRSTSTGTNE
jgi:hypothetical protein